MRLERTSTLAVDPASLWDAVATMDGVNAELRPFVRMTFPAGSGSLSTSNPAVTSAFRSWILLFGVVPIDRHRFGFEEIDAGRGFREHSSSWMNRSWVHIRTLEPDGRGTVIRDELVIEPRLPLASVLIRGVVGALFSHRHRRLRRRYGVSEVA